MNYTFEDWVNNKICMEIGFDGEFLANDSERYLELESMGKITYEVINKIQEAQSKTYEYIIGSSLNLYESALDRQTKGTLSLLDVLATRIKNIKDFISKHQDIYYEVILPRRHRGIKIGAKFITANLYLDYKNNKHIDAMWHPRANYQLRVNDQLQYFPTKDQWQFIIVEVQVRWMKRLEEIRDCQLIQEKRILDLKEKNREYDKLILDYHNRYSVATNFIISKEFIENEINDWTKNVRNPFEIQIGCNEGELVKPFNVAQYATIAYNYLLKGHNPQVKQLIKDAKEKCLEANNKLIEKSGKLTGVVPINFDFEQIIVNWIITGVGFAMYINFLQNQLRKDVSYQSFDKLFEDAILYQLITYKNAAQKEALRALHNYQFNAWLLEKSKNRDFLEINYKEVLTKENFLLYLLDERDKLNRDKTFFEKEKSSWKLKDVGTIDSFIKDELINRLEEIEKKLSTKIENWKKRDDKIGCAAFCELLLDHNFFLFQHKKSRIKSLAAFAMLRYGNEIAVQLAGSKKAARLEHKKLLKKYFK
ncbi:hypothetical protein [Niastella sp. OAS944]|uniref:hypothetical protein n=1 Tax=Niastella sp. OAS944 TaxID=2664089 RepID=UPI0035C86FB0|nr:hypothetical protein [Chitinophagaceae bacterium OAS944]